MNLTLQQLRLAVDVAATGSFSETAKRQNLTQPAVSRQIRQIELTLGTRLFDRTTRSVRLSVDGQQFIDVARNILDAYDEGIGRFRAYREGLRGKLTIAALPSLAAGVLATPIAEFARDRPEVELTLYTPHSAELLAAVRSGRADIAVTNDPGPARDLRVWPLFDDPMVALVSPTHPVAARTSISWRELTDFTFIRLEAGTSVRELTDQGFSACGRSPERVLTTDAIGSAAALVAKELGITAAPRSVMSLVSSRSLVTVDLVEPEIVRRIAVITRTDPALPPAVAQFVESLTAMTEQPPVLAEMIRSLEAGEAPPGPPWQTPAQILERFPKLAAVHTSEIEIEAPSFPATTLPARLYIPPNETRTDGLVWVHGGGFMSGHYDMPEAHWVALWLADHGTPVLTLNYRKALHGVHFPTLHEDVAAGWRWAHDHISEFGVERLHLGGASAGGALSASVTELAVDGMVPMPTSLLLAYPALHPRLPQPSGELAADLPGHEKARFPADLHAAIGLNYIGDPEHFANPIAFPGLRVTGFPPTIIRMAQYDDLRASGERFASDLEAKGIEVDSGYEPGSAHGYLNEPEDDIARPATISTLAAFNAWFDRFAGASRDHAVARH